MIKGSTTPRQMALTEDLVARCYRVEPNPGPNPDFVLLSDSERTAIAEDLLSFAPADPIWVFAYGSLIWSPNFEVAEFRGATALGWHRQFCIEQSRVFRRYCTAIDYYKYKQYN